MLKCLIALTSLLTTVAMAQSVWTWVDDQGQRHYSDTPVEGAVEMTLQSTQTFSGSALTGSRQSPPAAGPAGDSEAAAQYSVLDVISPEPDETLYGIGGNLEVELAIYPPLEIGHRIDAILDGEYRTLAARALTLTIPDVYRGEHTVQIVVVDVNGNQLTRSAPVTFFVRQNSIL